MKRGQYLPLLIVVISVGSAIMYALDRDWRRVVYWLSAASLTASITF